MEIIERLHAPEYQLITPAGRTLARERYLSTLASQPFYAGWDVGSIDARLSLEMALIRYQATLRFSSGCIVTCWRTDSYEKRGDHWQAVWSQAAAILPASSE